LFVFDKYDRIQLISNIDVEKNPKLTSLKRNVTKKTDQFQTLKNNIEAFHAHKSKPKVSIYNMINRLAIAPKEEVVICFNFRKTKLNDPLNQPIANYGSKNKNMNTSPEEATQVAFQFQHIYYDFKKKRTFYPNTSNSLSIRKTNLTNTKLSKRISPQKIGKNHNPLTKKDSIHSNSLSTGLSPGN
jgi:hypothetical protein